MDDRIYGVGWTIASTEQDGRSDTRMDDRIYGVRWTFGSTQWDGRSDIVDDRLDKRINIRKITQAYASGPVAGMVQVVGAWPLRAEVKMPTRFEPNAYARKSSRLVKLLIL